MTNNSDQPLTVYKRSTTVVKAFQVLEYVSMNQPVQPAVIAKELGLNRANVHRLLLTLADIGYIIKTSEGYRLSFKTLVLGRSIPLIKDLRSTVKPYLVKLMQRTGENAYLFTLVNDTIIAVDDIRSSHQLTLNPYLTHSFPVYACASGKLFLAYMKATERQERINRLNMKKLAQNTITSKEALEDQIADIRKKGYALDNNEFSDEIVSIAAPILCLDSEIIAAIAIVAPKSRIDPSKTEKHILSLTKYAKEISGYFDQETNQFNDIQ